jgi:hypothetical protein
MALQGFSVTNLRNFREFYLTCTPQIQQTASAEFKLSWSHYQVLMRVEDVNPRSFYEFERGGRRRVNKTVGAGS